MNDAWAVDERQLQGLHFTQKVAPSFDGRISWFAYEEAIDDWLDMTTLAPDKWAPSLKARLVGYASMYKPLLDSQMLKDPNYGVDYFKNELRPHFVKGVEAVLIFGFLAVTEILPRLARPPKVDWKTSSPPKTYY